MIQELNLLEETLEKTFEQTHQTRDREIKRILEALLFSSSTPLSLLKMKEIVEVSFSIKSAELKKLIQQLAEEYQAADRSFRIFEIAEGYILQTVEEMRPFIELLHQDRRGEKLSRAATEVLAIIAYRQPITKREIESIRGVDCTGSVVSLHERGLIEMAGRKDAPGKPIQYQVTKKFLQHFGLKDLKDIAGL